MNLMPVKKVKREELNTIEKGEKLYRREDCDSIKTKLFWPNPKIYEKAKEISNKLGRDYPLYWVINLGIAIFHQVLTPEVIKRVNNGESIAQIFNLKG